ncbi:saccharopine dehydrogenase family protein [Candidatus Solincola sp.]|nr:saccharopine dehydrogenase NADP-binding domain-containing protein [Actinomycetota bacterium]MDI7253022.1 saccharopine dehydrogenase NADP-binding domain-containing protein [Actinomycetota bacterium]
MKVLVMGGAGNMGSRAVEDLANTPGVERVTIGDANLAKAREIAGKLESAPAKVEAVQVDARNHARLVEVMRGYDVVASALGPFYLFETRLVKAALDADVNYISICDDWSAAQDTIIRFDHVARERGRLVVTGMGASPGLSNVGVRLLADQLDKVRKADIYVYMPAEGEYGEAVIKHTFFIYGTVVPVFREGVMYMLPAGSLHYDVEMPKFGVQRVWNIGHSEAVTLSRFNPHLEEVKMTMGMGKGSRIFVALGRLGFFSTPKKIDLATKLLLKYSKPSPTADPDCALRVDVTGEKDGRETTLTVCGIATQRESTGLALSIGTYLLGKGKLQVSKGGVWGPEDCFDPQEVLHILGEKGIPVYSDVAMRNRIN